MVISMTEQNRLFIGTHTHTYTSTDLDTHKHRRTHAHTHTHTHTQSDTQLDTGTHTHTHRRARAHTQAHTHIYALVSLSVILQRSAASSKLPPDELSLTQFIYKYVGFTLCPYSVYRCNTKHTDRYTP